MIESFAALVLVGVLNAAPAEATVPSHNGQQMYEALGCISCHGKHGNSPDTEYAPSLSGLNKEYIVTELLNFQSELQNWTIMNVMAPMIEGYEEEVADYLSKQAQH